MRLAEITWPKAEQYFRENDMVLVPIGSVECHGRHLPLGTDVFAARLKSPITAGSGPTARIRRPESGEKK